MKASPWQRLTQPTPHCQLLETNPYACSEPVPTPGPWGAIYSPPPDPCPTEPNLHPPRLSPSPTRDREPPWSPCWAAHSPSSGPGVPPQGGGAARGNPAHLDVHLGTLQEAQCGVACAVRAQGHQLLELLQVEPELGSSERPKDVTVRQRQLGPWGRSAEQTEGSRARGAGGQQTPTQTCLPRAAPGRLPARLAMPPSPLAPTACQKPQWRNRP